VQLVVARDVTAVRRLEEQLRQAQKMEAIGTLAGGIAHDFNNVLSVILSYSEMVHADLSASDPLRDDVEQIRLAAQRASELTRQLLAFSRRQVLRTDVVDVNAIVTGIEKMIRRALRDDIDLVLELAPDLSPVLADPGQLEQVVLNLVVNARDAMPSSGTLTIETANVHLDEAAAREHAGVVPGPHVVLTVADTGTGMDAATRARIFEPFFTTKEKGKGTGLGLSTAMGIVEQSGGQIWVESAPGRGAKFTVCFPRSSAPAKTLARAVPGRSVKPRGIETILVVDDEEPVRTVVAHALRRNGYQVIVAENGGDALLVAELHEGVIDLLLTDVVMKRLDGIKLAERLRLARPSIKVLLMSGYSDDLTSRLGLLEPTAPFLQKPVTPETLLRKVREVLDAAAPDAADAARSTRPGRKRTLLVVDDDAAVRSVVCNVLRPLDLDVLQAPSGDAALGITASALANVDVLLTDVVMPGLDGCSLARRLRALKPGVGVVFMSGYDSEVVTRHGVGSTDAFLAKPFTPTALRGAVAGALARVRNP